MVLYLTKAGTLADSSGNQPLIPLAPDRFQYRGSERTLTVLPAAAGAALAIRSSAPNTRAIEYVAVPRARLDAAALAAYAGDYRSPELDTRIRLSVVRDTLRLERGWEAEKLVPIYRDGFLFPGSGELVRFERDRRGRITGLVLYAGRVRHLRFARVSGER